MGIKNLMELTRLNNIQYLERWIGMAAGALCLLAVLVFDPPASLSPAAWRCAGMGTMMAIWWSTEAISIPATALLPIILIPALDLGSVKSATAPYANPTIYLFFGGFLIGLAMENCNLHRRIALGILHKVSSNPSRQIAGFMAATAFISMWVSNTATAVMMTPIGLSVSEMLTKGQKTAETKRFSTALLLGIAYAAGIGGIATLIGTPPNALLRAFLEEHYQIHVGFGQWMVLGVPLSALMLAFTWWWLTRVPFNLENSGVETALRRQLEELGPMSRAEKMVAAVFTLAALCWVFQPLIGKRLPFVNDTFIAMAAGILLFLLPINLQKREFLMDWKQTSRLPWGVLVLFGGGLSLAGTINSSGLADWLARQMHAISAVHVLLMILLVVVTIMFLTEVTSNTATAAAFLPLMGAMAVAQGISPQTYAIPAAIAASCAFMLPVATPPNAIVFGSGELTIGAMIRAGFALNLFGTVLITLACFFFADIIF